MIHLNLSLEVILLILALLGELLLCALTQPLVDALDILLFTSQVLVIGLVFLLVSHDGSRAFFHRARSGLGTVNR